VAARNRWHTGRQETSCRPFIFMKNLL
jgi:hypothetical protein